MGARGVIFWIWAPLQQTWAECMAGLMFLVSGHPGTKCWQSGCQGCRASPVPKAMLWESDRLHLDGSQSKALGNDNLQSQTRLATVGFPKHRFGKGGGQVWRSGFQVPKAMLWETRTWAYHWLGLSQSNALGNRGQARTNHTSLKSVPCVLAHLQRNR